ncbi:MAG: 50S ribosomal protein L25/general stress protein Ctc [Marinilabiliales bacterium]|nr:MAG: 50S ribosomal protein L25/general stress protein Ctc [Marinilabiliales bacterium]
MKLLEIKCSLRESVGKKDSRKLRKQGGVPCVLYGGGENIHFTAPENDFRHLVYSPKVFLLKLDIEGKVYDAVLQDIQFHPVTDRILHMDFFQVFEDRPVSIDVPVQLHGVPEGVKHGGKLALEARRLRVRGLPKDMPDILNVDVTNIGLGKSVKVGELEFEGLELLDFPNLVIASVKLTRAARGLTDEEEEAEGEEAVEGEGEGEGDKPEGEKQEGSGAEGQVDS